MRAINVGRGSAFAGRSITGAAALLATLALASSPARAGEPDLYGFGSRAAAMAGAVAADCEDFSGNYYNPAALASARGPNLAVGYLRAHNALRINGADNDVSPAHGIMGGLVAPGTILGVPFAFGVGTFIPDGGLSRIKALRQETPRWALYDERASILFLAAHIAVKPFKWLEVGGGVAFLAATRGRFAISGTADILNVYNSKLRHEVDADLTSVRYPQLGVRVLLPGFGHLAVVYRGETKLKLSIDADLAGAIAFGTLSIPLSYHLESRTVDAFLPQQIVAGVSLSRVDRLRINADFTFVNWAAYESPTAATKAHLAAAIPPGVPVTLPADPKPTKVIPPSFRNRLVPRVGIEYVVPAAGKLRKVRGDAIERRLLEIPVRAGYAFEQSPVPPQAGLTNFVDADRHTVTFGTGIVINAPGSILRGSVALDVSGMISILPERVTIKDNPADFIGSYRAGGMMTGFSSTLSATF